MIKYIILFLALLFLIKKYSSNCFEYINPLESEIGVGPNAMVIVIGSDGNTCCWGPISDINVDDSVTLVRTSQHSLIAIEYEDE